MRTTYSRRTLIKAGLGGLAGMSTLGLTACNDTVTTTQANPQGPVSLQLLFWGTKTRDTYTQQAISAFKASAPSVTIKSSYTAFSDYYKKFDPLVTAGKTPDLFQMDMAYLARYARQQTMYDLSRLIYNQTIDLSDFDPLMLANSKANNALYGIPLGGNYQSLVYDTNLVDLSNVGAPPKDMTWDVFATYTGKLSKALGPGVYGTVDASFDNATFEIWIRQRGKELYTVDGQLAYDQQDAEDWFNYWDQMRTSGACVPPAEQQAFTTKGGASNAPITLGKAVFGTPHSNEFESYQAANHHNLALHTLPSGSTPGLYYKPSLLLCISATTPYVQEAAQFINFIINDPAGVKAIGIERGIPGSAKAQTLLQEKFTKAQQQDFTFTSGVTASTNTRLKEVLDPPKASLITPLLQKAALDIANKKASVKDGTATFYQGAQKILNS